MKRSTVILFIDSISFICFVFLTSTGILLHYLLPPGSGRWSNIWDMNRHEWGDVHFWISAVFFSVLSLHLILHWKVIVNLVKGRHQKESTMRLGLGIVGLITILLFAAAPLVSPTNEIERSGGGHQHRGLHK
jgi:hypothetical protein